MTIRKQVPAVAELAEVFPYSRVVRVGNIIEVCSSGSYDQQGNLVRPGDYYAQTLGAYRVIERGLTEVGAKLDDIAKITIFAIDIDQWPEVARAHKELFEDIKPAVTMVQVSGLIEPEMLVDQDRVAVRIRSALNWPVRWCRARSHP